MPATNFPGGITAGTAGQAAAIADVDASAVDATYGAPEAAVLADLRTKLNALLAVARAAGLIAP